MYPDDISKFVNIKRLGNKSLKGIGNIPVKTIEGQSIFGNGDISSGGGGTLKKEVYPNLPLTVKKQTYLTIVPFQTNGDQTSNFTNGDLVVYKTMPNDYLFKVYRTEYDSVADKTIIWSSGDINVTDVGYSKVYYNLPNKTITAVDKPNKKLTVSGDWSSDISAMDTIFIQGSTANDATYTVSSVTYNSGPDTTDIVVSQPLNDNTVDGSVYLMGTTSLNAYSARLGLPISNPQFRFVFPQSILNDVPGVEQGDIVKIKDDYGAYHFFTIQNTYFVNNQLEIEVMFRQRLTTTIFGSGNDVIFNTEVEVTHTLNTEDMIAQLNTEDSGDYNEVSQMVFKTVSPTKAVIKNKTEMYTNENQKGRLILIG